MELQQITTMIMTAAKRIEKATTEIGKMAARKADAEQKYRIALAQEKYILKEQGMAITLIDDLAKGNENIAKLKRERDISEDLFKAAIKSLEALQSELSGLQSILKVQNEI